MKNASEQDLNELERQDIDIALQTLRESSADSEDIEEDGSREEAISIILSIGKKAYGHLMEQMALGNIRLDDYRRIESYWWDDVYNSTDDDMGYGPPQYEVTRAPDLQHPPYDGGFEDSFRYPSYFDTFDAPRRRSYSHFEDALRERGRASNEDVVSLLDALRFISELTAGAAPDTRRSRGTERGHGRYEFFPSPESRRDVFEYSRAIAEHLHEKKIPNLIVLDRSARPLYVGVREYWHERYPDERLPNIYFMNPKGFKAKEDLTPAEIREIMLDCELKGDVADTPHSVKSKRQILEELNTAYRELSRQKDKPVMLFDTCLHTGKTVRPVVDTLREAGFTDVTVGSINPSGWRSAVHTDFSITDQTPSNGCYPFDMDRVIEKTFNHIYSKVTDDRMKQVAGRRLRAEIRLIVREELGLKP